MTPNQDGPAETRVVKEGERVEAPGGSGSNVTEPEPEVDVSDAGLSADDVRADKRGPLTGRLIDGRYQILELIGEGGMGAVYRAMHTLMNKELAVKVLLPEYTAMEGLAKRFQQEAQSSSRLDHPGIIQVFDFGQTDDKLLYLVMAYLRGRSLSEVMLDESPLPQARAAALAGQICDALAHAHAHSVVHRDLKPDNVMIVRREDGTEQVKLLDFGIAKITQGEGAANGLTEVGAVFGTPEYLSPEQAAGDPTDHRTDLYSLGVILYEMLSGRKLFSADTNVKYLYAHMHDAPKPLTTVVPHVGLSPALDQVVLRMLAKDPNERYQSAEELSQAFKRVVSQPALAAHPGVAAVDSGAQPPVPANTVPPASTIPPANTVPPVQYTLPPLTEEAENKRKMVVWGLGAAVGALLLLVVALSIVLSGDDEDKRKKETTGRRSASEADLHRIRGLIDRKKLEKAEKRLNDLAQKAPKDPRVHVLYGHLHCRRKAAEACLAAYNTAAVLDRAVRDDAQLVANLKGLMVKRRGKQWGRPMRERAVGFAVQIYSKGDLKPPVTKMLTRFVNKWWEHDLIWQVIELLKQHKATLGVNWVHAYEQRFRSVDSCELRKKYIQEIVARKDKKLLGVLGKVYAERSLKKPWSKKRVSNACVSEDAADAIESLGGTLPPKKKSRRRRPSTIKGHLRKLINGL